jgi:hypothetical protein
MLAHAIAFLRAIHILSGGLWVGAAVLNAGFLIPSVMAAGPAGGQVMRVMVQVRRLPVFMNAVMAVTLITGIALYWRAWAGSGMAWIASGTGLAFTFGALCAFATAGIGHVVTVPAVRRIGQLGAAIAGAGGAPAPELAAEMGAQQRLLLRGVQVGSRLVVVATIAMAMARFL